MTSTWRYLGTICLLAGAEPSSKTGSANHGIRIRTVLVEAIRPQTIPKADPLAIYIYILYHIYIPGPSKGLRFGTPIVCSLRGYVSTPLSRTKKTQQDMVITMFIAPFLGDMVGDEQNNKNFDFGEFRHANDTRLPGSDTLPTRIKGRQNDTP